MSFKVEKQAYLNGELQTIGSVVDLDDKDLIASLLERGVISQSDGSTPAPAPVTEAKEAAEVTTTSDPLLVVETPVTAAQPTAEQIAQDLASVETPNNIQLS